MENLHQIHRMSHDGQIGIMICDENIQHQTKNCKHYCYEIINKFKYI